MGYQVACLLTRYFLVSVLCKGNLVCRHVPVGGTPAPLHICTNILALVKDSRDGGSNDPMGQEEGGPAACSRFSILISDEKKEEEAESPTPLVPRHRKR